MGIASSKLSDGISKEFNSVTSLNEESSEPATPISTPKLSRSILGKDLLDPRSPSKHIARTPIELLSGATSKLQVLTLEDAQNGTPNYTPQKSHIILGIDPRSPNIEIQRTPIVVSASPDKKIPLIIRNKNLDKVRQSASLCSSREDAQTAKLLESNPVTPKAKKDIYKRKSFVLLETNVDFTETDLDVVIKEKYQDNDPTNAQNPGPHEEISDPRSPTTNFMRTPILIDKDLEDQHVEHQVQTSDIACSQIQIKEVETKETSINIEEYFCVQAESNVTVVSGQNLEQNDTKAEPSNENEQLKEEESRVTIPEELANDELAATNTNKDKKLAADTQTTPCKTQTSLQKQILSPIPKSAVDFAHCSQSAPVSPPNAGYVTPKPFKSQPTTPPMINLTADIKELDKKLTHLIYEDQDLVVCPKIVKVKDTNRTPLGDRNGNQNRKTGHHLKVSDKPRKEQYIVSKIPVFKEKKIKTQCENTPPRGMRKGAHKKSKWDPKDDTLVI